MSETFIPAAETITAALELLGPDGEHWIQGSLRDGLGDFCVVGALQEVAPTYQAYADARDALKQTISALRVTGSGNIDRWNNRSTWPEVQRALQQTALRISA